MTEYPGWPAPVRSLATAIDEAVGAAAAGAAEDFSDALTQLARADRTLLADVLGDLAAGLLEQLYPDGMDAGDAEELLRRCLTRFSWCAVLDTDALVQALAGTLGVRLAEDEAMLPAALPNGLLIVAELLAGRPVAPHLDSALRELRRRQSIELP